MKRPIKGMGVWGLLEGGEKVGEMKRIEWRGKEGKEENEAWIVEVNVSSDWNGDGVMNVGGRESFG